MNTRNTVGAMTAAAVAVIVLAGCSESSEHPHTHQGSDDHHVINPLAPETITADQSAITAMQMILSWQPAVDDSKSAALHRARPWLGGELLALTDSTERAQLRPDAQWEQWAQSKDVVTAQCVRSDSTPTAPAGMRTLAIDVTCTQKVLHTSGRVTPLRPETWRTTVTRTDTGWLMTDYRNNQ